MAFVLSFSMMPMTAFAEGTDAVTEQQETQGSELPETVDTTDGSASVEDISGGNAVTKDAAVEAVQALINALPEEVTADNADGLQAQLMAIDEALAALDAAQTARLNMTRLENIYAALNVAVAAQATTHVDHSFCGATNCQGHGSHSTHEVVSNWIQLSYDEATGQLKMGENNWDKTSDGYILPNGNYYLGTDLKTDATITIIQDLSAKINLCLNGHSITAEGNFDVITQTKGEFRLCDCKQDTGKITHQAETVGRGVCSNAGLFYMYGGTITGNNAGNKLGGGVYAANYFHIFGGTISDNKATAGGGVYGSTSVYINGGFIQNNTATSGNGGGVYIGGEMTMNMYDVTITDNKASGNGGGVYLGDKCAIEMSNVTITGNNAGGNGGGMMLQTSQYIDMRDKVEITGNTVESKANNLYLKDSGKINVKGTLTGSKIGVSLSIDENDYVVVAKGSSYSLTSGDKNVFDLDDVDAGYVRIDVDNSVAFQKGDPHKHGICGKEGCTEADHDNVVWKGINDLDEITEDGNYYLKQSVNLSSTWTCGHNVKLCLNGKSIIMVGANDAIKVAYGNTFTLCDCGGNGTITHSSGKNGRGVYVETGSFTMYSGSITGNTAGGKGGGVYVGSSGSFTMYGGSIKNNMAGDNGGGVYAGGTITVSGGAEITNNNGSNVYLPSGKKITVGGALSDSTSIGVTSGAVPDDSTPVTIATAADNWINDDNFTADNSFYKVTVSADGKTVNLGLHEHQWKVRVKTGSENILEEYCDVAGCTVADGTLTLEAPDQEYSGAPYNAASCTKSGDWKHTPNVGEFFYTDSTGTKIDAPVKVGAYYANVTVDGVTAKKEFTIKSGNLVFDDFTFTPPSNLTYDGLPKTATVTLDEDKADAAGTITVKYIDKDNKVIVDENGAPVTSVTEAGTYTVGIDVTKGTGYDSMAMSRSEWTFTIGPKPVTITGISADDKTYDGTNTAVIKGTPAISGLVAGDEGAVTVETANAKATFADADAGTAKTVNFSGYALTGAKAGNYTLTQPSGVTADIHPKALTIADVTVAEKAYDGTTEAAVTSVTFNGLVNGESLGKDRDYTVTGNFADAAVGENKDVVVTVKLADSVKNYTLSDTGYTKNGCKIVKATVTAPATTDLTIINGSTTIYTVMLPQLLPSLVLPQQYGKLTYGEPKLTITDSNSGYQGIAEFRSNEYEYGKLALQFTRTGDTEGPIGTITVTVHSENYEDITLKINIQATAKIVPQLEGTLKLTPSDITYGEKLSHITISGTMMADGSEITGTFAWQNPDDVLNAGDQVAAWKFTPEDTQTYAETTGTTTVRVNKAEQSGAVLMGNYTYNETPATPNLTKQKGDNSAVVTYYYSTTRTNSGGTEWKAITPTTLKAGTYYMYAVIGETVNYKAYTTEAKAFEVWKAAPTYIKPSGLTAKYGQKLSEITLLNPAGNMPGTWSWEAPDTVIDKTGTVKYDAYFTPDDTNYKKVVGAAIEITVARGDGRNLATEELTLAFNDSADHTYTPDWSDLPAGQTWNYECGSSIGSGSNATLTKLNVSAADGGLTYAVSDGQAGDEITVILKACCNNYEDFTITLHIQITKAAPAGEPKYTLITTEGKTLADAGLTLNGSTLNPADGTLEWVGTDGNVLSDDTEVKVNTTYKWRFTPADTNYNSLIGEIELYHVDAPAISAQPKSVSVTVGEKATFEVTATGTDVTYQWKIDRNDGNGFTDIPGATGAAYTTGVTDKDCDGFKYQCVIRNAAGSVTTDTVVLTVKEKLYEIIDGANSSWTQSTDGSGSIRIRGNGEISKFVNVKVDGTIVDPANYTVTEGSTIIELKADYLKTLSEGTHTFEIIWTDGTAGTSFTVAKNTSDAPGNDDNNKDENNDNNGNGNDSNDGSNNDSNNGSSNTAGSDNAVVQILDGSPNTGDASGIWIALFVVSAVGLAAMLVRRKKQ